MVDVKIVADYIDYVVSLVGVNYVGFGLDYDGVGDIFFIGLKDVFQYFNFIYELLQCGYLEFDIEKICYKNVWWVWQVVEDVVE